MRLVGSRQQGVALIVVLLIVALVSVLATQMGSRLQLNVMRASNIKDNNQAYWYAMGAEHYARKSIAQLLEAKKGVLSLEGDWSEPLAFPLEGGGIQAQLLDMQACFNINGLRPESNSQNQNKAPPPLGTLSDSAQAFKQLLELVLEDANDYDIEVAVDSLVDWLDEDDRMSQSGAEDADYESLPNPYLAANAPMVNISELRLVNGFSPAWIEQLKPYLCAIPQYTTMKINVNTVTEENAVILAAMTGVPLADMQALVASRPPDGYQTPADFLADPRVANVTIAADRQAWFDVKTEYFQLRTKTQYNNATFNMLTVFKVDNNTASVVKREFGGAG